MKINGFEIPAFLLIPSIAVIFWLGGLSFSVADNSQEIEKHSSQEAHTEASKKLVQIEARQEKIEEDIEELKENEKEQTKLLNEIAKKLDR
jgi:cell division protein FtsB